MTTAGLSGSGRRRSPEPRKSSAHKPGIDAFLFDFDGTLVDSERIWVAALYRTLTANGAAITRAQALQLVYGRAWPEIRADVQRLYPDAAPDGEALSAATMQIFRACCRETDIRIRSSVALLVRLAHRFPVAIVSGSTRQAIADGIAMLDIGAAVSFYLGCEDYSPGKPDPAGFLLAAERLRRDPERCLVFEDSTAGVLAAKAAGMTCVALQIPNSPPRDLAAADLVLQDLREFDMARYAGG